MSILLRILIQTCTDFDNRRASRLHLEIRAKCHLIIKGGGGERGNNKFR